MTLLLLFLRERGLCAAAASGTTVVDRVANGFAQHLQRNQELAAATVDTYTRLTRQFLVWRFGQAEVCLHDLRPSDSIAFIRQESKRMAPSAVKGVAKVLRSSLRFCEFRGEVSPDSPPVCHPLPLGRPRRRSPRQSACGHVSAENRQTQARFECVECGYENNADVVGAINVFERGHRLLACGETAQSGCSVKQEPAEGITQIIA